MSQIILDQLASSPATPAMGKVKIYAKNDGSLYFKNDSGVEVILDATADISQLTGDVTAIGPGSAAATVVNVGGASAASIASGVTKLSGIESGATANSSDSFLLDRSNHSNNDINCVQISYEVVDSDKTITVPVNHQILVFGNFQIDGVLNLNGSLVVL